jgi:hypothetical protein
MAASLLKVPGVTGCDQTDCTADKGGVNILDVFLQCLAVESGGFAIDREKAGGFFD